MFFSSFYKGIYIIYIYIKYIQDIYIIYIYIYKIYIYIYIYNMYIEVAIDKRRELDLNPQPLNFIQKL